MTTMPHRPHRDSRDRKAARRNTSLTQVILLITMMGIGTTTIGFTNRMMGFISTPTVRAFSTPTIAGISTRRLATMTPKRCRTRKEKLPPFISSNGLAHFSTTTIARGTASDDNDQTDDERIVTSTSSSAPTPFEKLFQSTMSRAYSTTATLENIKRDQMSEDPTDVSATVESILDATIVESESNSNKSTTENKQKIASNVDSMMESTIAASTTKYSKRTETRKQQQTHKHHSKKSSARYEFPFATSYKSHPALNNVALAHALWASVIRPNRDVVIDATCGNGNDSIVLAEILFGTNNDDKGGELLCVDVQSLACERTTMALKEVLPPSVTVLGPTDNGTDTIQQSVNVLNASHEQLPRPTNPEAQVGLVVYNLGWLPGGESENGKDCVTTMDSTMASLVDATSLLRVGGMLSVVTYPQTGPDEDRAVKLFVTCLALLSSRTRTWQEEVEAFVSSGDEDNQGIANIVTRAMETVVARGDQTWRVSQHDKLGMDRPPILFTATRIK